MLCFSSYSIFHFDSQTPTNGFRIQVPEVCDFITFPEKNRMKEGKKKNKEKSMSKAVVSMKNKSIYICVMHKILESQFLSDLNH